MVGTSGVTPAGAQAMQMQTPTPGTFSSFLAVWKPLKIISLRLSQADD